MTIAGVQGDQINLNSTKQILQNLIGKIFTKKMDFQVFFSKLDTLYFIILPMGVSKQFLLSQYPSPKKVPLL